jgi:hypothetical protein
MSYTDFTNLKDEFDILVSYSSIEHSGLGRYGDPLNPSGDFETMTHCYTSLKPNGIFFLGIPVGNDTLVWNAHRVYGPIRFPALVEKFKEIGWVGKPKELCFQDAFDKYTHPISILQKQV